MASYGDLFKYLEFKIVHEREIYISNFYHTQKFCEARNLDTERIVLTLYDFGGHNDVQILYNVVGKIDKSLDLDAEIETPVEFAIRNNLYRRWHEGMWVSCKKGAEGAMVDLNKANEMMFDK